MIDHLVSLSWFSKQAACCAVQFTFERVPVHRNTTSSSLREPIHIFSFSKIVVGVGVGTNRKKYMHLKLLLTNWALKKIAQLNLSRLWGDWSKKDNPELIHLRLSQLAASISSFYFICINSSRHAFNSVVILKHPRRRVGGERERKLTKPPGGTITFFLPPTVQTISPAAPDDGGIKILIQREWTSDFLVERTAINIRSWEAFGYPIINMCPCSFYFLPSKVCWIKVRYVESGSCCN